MKNKDFDSLKTLMVLMKHKIFILTFVLLATAAAVVISLNLPNWYRATANVVPPNTENIMNQKSFGGIGSALKDFGLTKLGGSSGGENYTFMAILDSRSLKDSLIKIFNLMQVYEIEDSSMEITRAELNNNMDITLEVEGNYTISFLDTDPERAAKMANTFVELANELSMKMFHAEIEDNLAYAEKRLLAIDSTLKVVADSLSRFSKKHQIFSPLEQAQAISVSLAEFKAQEIQYDMMYEFYKKKYGDSDPYTIMQKEMLDQVRNKIREIQFKPGFAGNFPLDEASQVGYEYLRLYTDFETLSKVKAMLTPSFEKAKIDQNSKSRYLYVMDEARAPEKKDKPKRSLIVAGTFAGSFVLAVLMVLTIHSIRVARKKYKEFKSSSE